MSDTADGTKSTGSARQQILADVRRYTHGEKPLPSLEQNWIRYPDRLAQFAAVLDGVGGKCVSGVDPTAANVALNEISPYRDAKQRVSLVSGIGETNIDFASIQDPHFFEPIDFAVLPGEFGVAENS